MSTEHESGHASSSHEPQGTTRSMVPLRREAIVPTSDRGRLAAIVATCSLAGLAGGMALSMLAESHRAARSTYDPGRARYLEVRDAEPVTWLGVRIQDVRGHRCAGTRVSTVTPASPAALAGVQAGDLIVSFGGDPVCTADHLIDVVRASDVGATPEIVVLRRGEPMTVHPSLREMPAAIRASIPRRELR